jgi:hypothetical protein
MRALLAFLALICFGCTADHPTPEERALVSKVESIVTLPKGGGDLKCYERHYALLQGKEMEQYVGASLSGLAGRKLLVGHYQLGDKPGIHWAQSAKELPKRMDGGCNDIRVWHRVGDKEANIAATCESNIAGLSPKEVVPPVAC